jgi:hypothetical protein
MLNILAGKILPLINSDGTHKVFIAAIKESQVNPCTRFKETTPKVIFVFKGIESRGTISLDLNLVDYKTADQYTQSEIALKRFKFDYDGTKYEVDDNDYRMVCDAKTQDLSDIISYISNQCGYKEGDDIYLHQLLGKQLTIRVRDKKITHTLTYENRY